MSSSGELAQASGEMMDHMASLQDFHAPFVGVAGYGGSGRLRKFVRLLKNQAGDHGVVFGPPLPVDPAGPGPGGFGQRVLASGP